MNRTRRSFVWTWMGLMIGFTVGIHPIQGDRTMTGIEASDVVRPVIDEYCSPEWYAPYVGSGSIFAPKTIPPEGGAFTNYLLVPLEFEDPSTGLLRRVAPEIPVKWVRNGETDKIIRKIKSAVERWADVQR